MNPFMALRRTTFCLCLAGLSACVMYMPAARDDFSLLGNDPFSNLIREGRYEKGDPNKGRSVGFNMLDQEKMTELSQQLFLGKESTSVAELFDKHNGKCVSSKNNSGEALLICTIERRWKLKNIGAKFDTSNWPDPGARLVFDLILSPNGKTNNINLMIKDISTPKFN